MSLRFNRLLCKDIANLIATFLPKYDLFDWINPEKLSWKHLSRNPRAIEMLAQNPDKIFWLYFSGNSGQWQPPRYAHPFSKIIIDLLRKNPDKINWVWLSENSSDEAIDFLLENQDEIYLSEFSSNTNPRAIEFLREKSLKDENIIYWLDFSQNPSIFQENITENNIITVLS